MEDSKCLHIELDKRFLLERIYFEIECLSAECILKKAFWATKINSLNKVRLGIIITTYNRKEFLLKILEDLNKDKDLLQNYNFEIFIVDNASSLNYSDFKDFKNIKVHLIPNINTGGSGGFARGLLEAEKLNKFTHYIFMDDDIIPNSENIKRIYNLYKIANKIPPQKLAFGATLLSSLNTYVVYEMGAYFLKKGIYPIYHLTDLTKLENLDAISKPIPPDYNGWWFFSFPSRFVKEWGFPFPFFIKGDDIEYSLRFQKKYKGILITLPNIFVIHQDFRIKKSLINDYFWDRNVLLITNYLYNTKSISFLLNFWTSRIIKALKYKEYGKAIELVNAFEDFIRGPKSLDLNIINKKIVLLKSLEANYGYRDVDNLLKLNDFTKKAACEIKRYFKDYKYYPLFTKEELEYINTCQDSKKKNIILNLIRIITFYGHLLPDFLLKREEIIGLDPLDEAFKYWRAKKVLRYNPVLHKYKPISLQRKLFFKILLKWSLLVFKFLIKGKKEIKRWEKEFDKLISKDFWENFLKLSKR